MYVIKKTYIYVEYTIPSLGTFKNLKFQACTVLHVDAYVILKFNTFNA